MGSEKFSAVKSDYLAMSDILLVCAQKTTKKALFLIIYC